MTDFLEYELQDGYVHNWLVAGPLAIPVPRTGQLVGDDLRLDIARRHHHRASDIHEPPIELASFQIGESELMWRYAKCLDDHLLDLSATYPTLTYLRSWAYCQIAVPSAQQTALVLTTHGPADVWVNRTHVHRHEGYAQDGRSASLPVKLEGEPNEVLIRFEQVAVHECDYAIALHFSEPPTEGVTVKLPVGHPNVARRQKLERIYAQAHIEHNMLLSGQNAALRWDEVLDESDSISFWVQDEREHIQISGAWETRPGERLEIGHSQLALDEGPYHLVLLPPTHAIERFQIVYNEHLPFHVLENAYSEAYYGTYEDRRQEALEHIARREGGLYAEICKFHRGRWATVDASVLEDAVARIDRREEGCVLHMIGLLGAMSRYSRALGWLPDLRRSLERCVLDFTYWHDEPGASALGYTTEGHSILYHACEILAGQLYPDQVFSNAHQNAFAGQDGQWHRQKGERLALEWLRRRGTAGFQEWDSNDTFEQVLLALSHLADLAEDVAVRELAAVVIDKLLFTIALNSYRGVFGSTHGRTEASMITGGQLEATSGVTRLLWGMGVWNHHIRALAGLACSGYEAPPLIPAIAADLDRELWARERHAVADELHSRGDPSTYVNKVTYRTKDYMLCSAQDYRPGAGGDREHVWQATLGPDAVVYVNHPACMSQEEARRPNFWRGNGALPRVAQWKDVLVAVHRLPGDGKPTDMGFTHAYFPTYEFDEYTFEENVQGLQWAFARKGSGYLALAASQGLELLRRGLTAYRELRSYGPHNVWLCMLGREATDGSFAEFQEAVLALDVETQALNVRCTTLRGERLSFGWEGPLLVDGEEQPLSGYSHYDSPYCVAEMGATEMDIRYGDYTMRLSFE